MGGGVTLCCIRKTRRLLTIYDASDGEAPQTAIAVDRYCRSRSLLLTIAAELRRSWKCTTSLGMAVNKHTEQKNPSNATFVQPAFVLSTLPYIPPPVVSKDRVRDPSQIRRFVLFKSSNQFVYQRFTVLSRSPRRGSPQYLQHRQTGSLLRQSWRAPP